jgi:hypothetical protein
MPPYVKWKDYCHVGAEEIGELEMLLADEQFLQMFDYP